MKIEKTYTANIYIGLQEGYTKDKIHTLAEVVKLCQEHCDKGGLCVTVTPTTVIYKAGREDGAIVGTINYPRFPEYGLVIKAKAVVLARLLMSEFNQERCSVVCTEETIMLEKDDLRKE